MTRHIVDTAKSQAAITLPRFLSIARRRARQPFHPLLARAPRPMAGAQAMVQFCRIDRKGPGRI